AVLDHRGDLVAGVDMHQRDRDVAEERLAGQPEQHGAVLADRPQHGEALEVRVRFTKDVYTLVLELVEMVLRMWHDGGAPIFPIELVMILFALQDLNKTPKP